MYKQDNLTIINDDCMNILKQTPDNYYDLCLVDPPYGIGRHGGESGKNWKKYENKGWDNSTPTQEYFTELFRVSKNQIIWGANYFTKYLPNSMGWIVWDKGQKLTMSDGELAFSSFQKALRIYVCNRCFIGDQGGLLHPTQKPVKLYNWIYKNYAEEGQKILDTHLGSGSNAIAAHYAKMSEFVGVDLDEDYYKAACERIRKETRQLELF